MRTRGRFRKENRIGRRLIVLVISFSSAVALCVTAVQLTLQHRELRRALDRALDDVGLYVETLEGSVWDFDGRQVQRVLDALVLVPNVARVRVTDASSGRSWQAGHDPPGGVLTRVYPLHHLDRGVRREIGRVELVASLEGIDRQVVVSGAAILVSNALLSLSTALLMVFFIRRLVTSRLERMAARVRGLAPALLHGGGERAQPVPPELDELDAVDWALSRASEEVGVAVAALRESEAHHRRIVETANEGIWIVDSEGRIAFANRQLGAFLGRPAADLLGARLADFLDGDDEGHAAVALLGRRRLESSAPEVLRFRREDGTDRFGLVGSTPLVDERGASAGALGMVADVTDQRRLEEQLRQSQKLEAVGRLAAGVAHDFNNLLTAMLGDASMLAEELPRGSRLHDGALEIAAAAQRAALLTRQLLAFGRRQVAQPQVLDLNEVVTSTERMLRRLIGEDVELVTVLAPALGRVRADPGQVEQVIVNLAVNARDAMPGGGRLTIETANGESAGADPRVVLSVRDTGTGMSEEVRAHLFEPFFTTKGPGKGTGLGLSTVYGIVQQAGGEIRVESALGAGTTMRVCLPRVDDAPRPVGAADGVRAAARGTETVLFVDDEPLVRAVAGRVLRAAGYAVLDAPGADEALSLLASCAGGIHLLVTDVVLPGMAGPELAARVRRAIPGLPVLFVSGYSDRAIALEPYGGHAAFLPKPFTPAELAARVRQILDRPPQEARTEPAPTEGAP